jgi:hypothetical protein
MATADAQAVGEVIADSRYCGYPAGQVTRLQDAAATRQGLLEALAALAGRVGPEQTVFFFYSGHGFYGADGYYYLTTHDTQLNAERRIVPQTGLSELELLEALRKLPVKRLLLLVNACHAGNLAVDLGMGDEPELEDQPLPTKTADSLLSTGEGRLIITASRAGQKSWGRKDQPLSFFAQALVEGLRGEGLAENRQGYISAFGLYEHLYYRVTRAAKKLTEPQTQEPELTVLHGVGPFPVALYAGATAFGDFDASEALPAEGAVRQVDPDFSQRLYEKALQQAAVVIGSGVVVQGNNNTVLAPGAVQVKGNVKGDVVTGTKVTQQGGDNALQIGQARDVTINQGPRRGTGGRSG